MDEISDWKQADRALQKVVVTGHKNNRPVTVRGTAEGISCIGIGTDAAVFRYEKTPGFAFKRFSVQAADKKDVERQVYERLDGCGYFPRCYGDGPNYLVLSFEQGPTLYDCLIRGIPIPDQVLRDVEAAREFVRSKGLNPRDTHLKNVLLQDGRAKVVDVSEFVKPGNDRRWEHLVWGYRYLYPLIKGVKIPSWLLEMVRKGYNLFLGVR